MVRNQDISTTKGCTGFLIIGKLIQTHKNLFTLSSFIALLYFQLSLERIAFNIFKQI